MSDESRREAVRREFTLQAEALSRGRTFTTPEAIEPFLRLLAVSPPARVLDLACGPGIVTAELARRGFEASAIDLTPVMIERARARCQGLPPVAFRVGAAEELPFPDEDFDAAVTRLSLHHFRSPAAVLEELHRVLRPGGCLVVGDIVCSPDPEEAALHNALETLRDPSHVRLLPARELEDELASAGFRINRRETWDNPKSFDEWAALVAEGRAMQPVRRVMEALARAGVGAGFDLRLEAGELRFTHRWLFLQASKPA